MSSVKCGNVTTKTHTLLGNVSPLASANVKNSCTMYNNVKHVRMSNAKIKLRAFIKDTKYQDKLLRY